MIRAVLFDMSRSARNRAPMPGRLSLARLMRSLGSLPVVAVSLLTACSNSGANSDGLSGGLPPVTQDAATRAEPVVVGRPARVFIFAGLGNDCQPLSPPEVTILQQPSKGSLSLVANQETTVRTSAQGTCIGRSAKGTAVYYTARDGADGTDRFAVSAKLGGGEAVTRTFEVTIAQ